MITDKVHRKCKQSWIADGICQGCSRSFSKGGASFTLENAPSPHLLIDLDIIPCIEHKTRCDYIFIADDSTSNIGWVVPIEMSSSPRKKPEEIRRQLQAGAQLAEQVIPRSLSLGFKPVFVGKNREARTVRSKEVKFHDARVAIEMIPNGQSITKAL